MRTKLVAPLALLALLATLFAASAFARTPDRRSIDHLLSRMTFGATEQDRLHVAGIGIDRYISEQLDPSSIDDHELTDRLAALSTLRTATPPLIARFNPPKPQAAVISVALPLCTGPSLPDAPAKTPPAGPQPVVTELQRAAFLRAVYSRRQLYERMVRFWENHFSVFVNKDADRIYLTSFDRDTIRPFALGEFRALLGATAHSPAMLYYLDNWQSGIARSSPLGGPRRRTGGLNENYARELLELHTLGVNGGYIQKDVEEVARCFTGWTIYKVNDAGLFMYDPSQHDDGEKIVLGRRIPPGGGIADGEMVLDILARHPSTAHFIATKLARMLVSDDPPESVIQRAAAVFLSTNGSIAATVRSIITSREFANERSFDTKVKSPFEYAVSAVRSLGATTDGRKEILDWIARMGEPIFGRVTPDGYPDRAATWISTGTLLQRMNFAIALAKNEIPGTSYPRAPDSEDETKVALAIGSPKFQLR
jgi:uncharacterized protein (DUF1800 family)